MMGAMPMRVRALVIVAGVVSLVVVKEPFESISIDRRPVGCGSEVFIVVMGDTARTVLVDQRPMVVRG